MASLGAQLIDGKEQLSLLFTPPFDHTLQEPGYIKGYPPGVRENGGQYTHASAWNVVALAMLGEGDQAGALLAMLNPITHANSAAAMHTYKVEPYVVAADVYSVAPHIGRGGWTWYTGSAAWLYRAAVEFVIGLRREGDVLAIDPCVPKHWPSVNITYRHLSTVYHIHVENTAAVNCGIGHAELDGVSLGSGRVRLPLIDDGGVHRVSVTLGIRHIPVSGQPDASAA